MASNLLYVLIALVICVWLASKLRSLSTVPTEETWEEWEESTCIPQTAKFELMIQLYSTECGWTTSHQFMWRPEGDTVKALVAEAVETFIGMYDFEPEKYNVMLKQLETEEVEAYVSE